MVSIILANNKLIMKDYKKNIGELDYTLRSVLIGMKLSDAFISKPGKNAYIKFE
jgi:hypothetical protein